VKLYLLHNGVNVRIMAFEGPRVAPEEVIRASATMREFFNRGTRETILDVDIRPEAVECIVKAICSFNDEPVPLVTALTKLLNFCRDAERNGFSGAQAALADAFRPLI
jgi:hypothetical protein